MEATRGKGCRRMSLPARGAWVEISSAHACSVSGRRSPHGERGLRVNPKFCVNSNWGANRAKLIQGGSRVNPAAVGLSNKLDREG